jgi:hypothetical protein
MAPPLGADAARGATTPVRAVASTGCDGAAGCAAGGGGGGAAAATTAVTPDLRALALVSPTSAAATARGCSVANGTPCAAAAAAPTATTPAAVAAAAPVEGCLPASPARAHVTVAYEENAVGCTPPKALPQVFYASRTHSQLRQAVRAYATLVGARELVRTSVCVGGGVARGACVRACVCVCVHVLESGDTPQTCT